MKKSVFLLLSLVSCSFLRGQVSDNGLAKEIVAVNHDDLAKSDYVGTRQIYEQYGFNANFNFILTPFSSQTQQREMVENVSKLIADGNHLGLHAVMGGTFWWMNKLFDVRPDGFASFAPTLDELRSDIGSGRNIFGYDIENKKISQMGFATLPSDLSQIMMADLTEEDYKRVISNYSFYFNETTKKGLDLQGVTQTWKLIKWLEYWYNELIDNNLGYSTISESVDVQFAEDYCYPQDGNINDYYPDAIHLENGKIVFFDDTGNVNYNNSEYQKVGYFKRGFFKGCASTCNYEVADRCIDVAKAFCSHYFGTNSFTNYGRHGVQYFNPTWVDDDGFSFDNREKTIISGEVGKFFHSRTKRFITGYELLLEKGFTMTTGPTSPREPILETQVGLYYGQDGIRSPYFNSSGIRNYLDLLGVSSAYTSTMISESLFQSFVANENNLIKFFYENAGRQLTNENGEKAYVHTYFKNAIDYIRSCLGTGKIPSLSFDTIKDDPSVMGAVELLCKYCMLSNLIIVPFETARIAALDSIRDKSDNYFPNPNFENTLLPILDGTSDVSSANIPDGWWIESTLRKGQIFTTTDCGREKGMSVSNETENPLTFGTKIYGLPPGEYDFSFYAKGDATVRLFLKKNSDFISQYYGGKTRFYATDQTEISTSDYQQYQIAFSIPEPHVNSYSFPEEGGVIYNQFAQGYEDNVSNVRVQISIPQSKGLTIYGVRLGQKNDNNAIRDIETMTSKNEDGRVYNVMGQLVTPSHSGLYIKNGKKKIWKINH